MRGLNVIYKNRGPHIQQESKEKLQQALKHKIQTHKEKCTEIREQVYYKKDKEGEWRGPGKVIGMEGKKSNGGEKRRKCERR